MKNIFIYGLALTFSVAFTGCDKKASETNNTTAETPQEDLSAADLINNPNTANPEEVKAGPTPKMSFEEETHDFGTIKQGEKVSHTFTFKNTGDAPLIIESASASCGCTVPNWPREPIAPGESGKIDVVFNSEGKMGVQNKEITIRANTSPNITKINIKTDIKEAAAGTAAKQ